MAPLKERDDTRIIDIRRQEIGFSVLDDMHQKLRPGHGKEKKMPTLLLYDEKGLKLFEEITYLDEYYLTGAEIDVLETYADHIAERIQSGSQVIELGSGYEPASMVCADATPQPRSAVLMPNLPLRNMFVTLLITQQ